MSSLDTIPVLLQIAELRFIRNDDAFLVPFGADGEYIARIDVDEDDDIIYTAQAYLGDTDIGVALAAANLAHRKLIAPASSVRTVEGDTVLCYGKEYVRASYPTAVQLDLLVRLIRGGSLHADAVHRALAGTQVPDTVEMALGD